MILGWQAPLKGSPTGVADYADTLGRALERLRSLHLTAGAAPVHVYHLGNNKLHTEIYARSLQTPGILVLHDAVLQHLMLGTRTREEYIAEWVHNYGVWRRELGEDLWESRARSAVDPRYFNFPMLRSAVESALAVIVHNPGAAAIAQAHGAKKIFTIPHFYESMPIPVADSEVLRFRQRLGIDPAAILFGVFGYLRETKRIPACIEAFRRLNKVLPRTALLLAGDPVSGDLRRLLAAEAAHPNIYRTGHLSERDLGLAAAAVDCCLNLRYPGAGETSGVAIRLMGIGKPVIAMDTAENSAIPASALLRVKPGVAEVAELFDHMILVAKFPEIARAAGTEAQLHIRKCHNLETVVGQYWEALCAVTS